MLPEKDNGDRGRPVAYLALLAALSVQVLLPGKSLAQVAPETERLTVDLNFYPYLEDVKDDSDLTFLIGARLPYRFSYFSFINFRGLFRESELQFIVTEQNLRWKVAERFPFDLTAQLNKRRGSDNDVWRLGFRWRLNDTPYLRRILEKIHLVHNINFHVKNFDERGDDNWQMEHTFKMTFPYLSKRLYLSGFLDHTFGQDVPENHPARPIIFEIQAGMRIFYELYAVTEYRINQNRRSDVNNLAVGFEYKLGW